MLCYDVRCDKSGLMGGCSVCISQVVVAAVAAVVLEAKLLEETTPTLEEAGCSSRGPARDIPQLARDASSAAGQVADA